ncbi:MAG: TonB-dependent receptor plug [Mucilaginibacter sp.]|nr:TonB-dependent receptor plug [Mucilaginibacter sp.]
MKKLTFILLGVMLGLHPIYAQSLHGIIHDKKERPINGASVIVAGTFRATSTDSLGRFTINDVIIKDSLIIKVSAIGFDDAFVKLAVVQLRKQITITLSEKTADLKEVIISAGSFEAGDAKKTTILKPFDLATVAASPPDVFKAINELPGTSKVGESEGLYVRGGAASETKAVIDGLIVQDPFFSSVPGVAQSGRFSAFLFKGTSFSTGGYSAQYGDALSSVLLLNTQDLAQASSQTLVLSTAGISGNLTQRWQNTSLVVNAKYYNLRPSFFINKQNYTYNTAPQGAGGNFIFRTQDKQGGIFKLYASYDQNKVNLQIPYLYVDGKEAAYSLDGKNVYINSSYKKTLGKWLVNAGSSFSTNHDYINFDTSRVVKQDSRIQGRAVLSRYIGERSKLIFGSEVQDVQYKNTLNSRTYRLNEVLVSNFAEAEFYLGNKIAARAGIREEGSKTLHQTNIAPRASIAYVLNPNSQFSAGYGNFYQLPQETYLYTNHNLSFEKATHYILNYQYTKNSRTFRLEGYYKNYSNLVTEDDTTSFRPFNSSRIPTGSTSHTGYGYAKGFDIFWYDKKSVKNLDYWIAYSYLDTKRLFENYPIAATPTFAANHNISVVVKYNIPETSINLGFTYNYTSGRPYYNPNHPFLSDRTPSVNNLIFSGNYSWFVKNNLFAVFLYADNILGIHNVYNYYYASQGDHHYTLTPPAYRSIYAGINITLAKRKTIMGINF